MDTTNIVVVIWTIGITLTIVFFGVKSLKSKKKLPLVNKIVAYSLIIFSMLTLFAIPGIVSPESDIGQLGLAVSFLLVVLFFYLTALLIVFFGLRSLYKREAVWRLGNRLIKLKGVSAIIPSLIYTIIGLSFLFFLLSITFETLCNQHNWLSDCSNNILTKIWSFVTTLALKVVPNR